MYEYRRGATILLPLDAVRGDVAQVSGISAAMRRWTGSSFEAGSQPIALVASVRSATGSDPAGWTLSLSATHSATLQPGTYRVEARLTVAGGVIFTDPAEVRIVEPVAGP